MDFFEKELRAMFEKHQLLKEQKYCGNVLLAKLDGELRVKLQFVTQGTAEKYTALAATVINRTDGTVDKQTFRFSDIIGKRMGGQSMQDPYVWTADRCAGPHWYTPITSEDRIEIAQSVVDYVGMYQEQGFTQVM